MGNFYPPCGAAGSILQVSFSGILPSLVAQSVKGIVDVETGRRENDVRIGVLYVEFVSGFVSVTQLAVTQFLSVHEFGSA